MPITHCRKDTLRARAQNTADLIIVQTLADEGPALLRRELSAAVPSDENRIHVDAIVAKPAIPERTLSQQDQLHLQI